MRPSLRLSLAAALLAGLGVLANDPGGEAGSVLAALGPLATEVDLARTVQAAELDPPSPDALPRVAVATPGRDLARVSEDPLSPAEREALIEALLAPAGRAGAAEPRGAGLRRADLRDLLRIEALLDAWRLQLRERTIS